MKKSITWLFTFSAFISIGQLTLSGSYQGNNIYVSNPYTDPGFCVDSVYVNSEIFAPIAFASAFEIPLNLKYDIGDSLDIVIYHQIGCSPKILSMPTRRSAEIKIEEVVLSDSCSLSFEMQANYRVKLQTEQFLWNKWLTVTDFDTVSSKGQFSFNLSNNMHSGINKFRVCAHDIHGRKHCSQAVTYDSSSETESFKYIKEENSILFNTISRFELFDVYGNILKMGHSEKVDVSGFKKGTYFLNFGNQTKKIVLKPSKK